MCPQPSAWTQIKKETRIARTWHGLVFHGFFWYYWANDSWIWGWFIGICECWGTPFSWRYRYCYSAYRQQPPPNLKPILTFPKGKLGWVIIRGGTDSLGSSYQTSGQAGFCLSPNGVCHIGDKWATSVQQTCPSGATCLPMLGNVLAPSGHAACPKLHKNPNEMKRLTHQQE